MSSNAAIIVEYIDKEGKTQKGLVYQCNQVNEIVKAQKVLIRLVTPGLVPLLDENGKERSVLKSGNLLTVIGFSD